MGADVAAKEFEAGLSLLHMMQWPSDASSTSSNSPVSIQTPTATKKRASGAASTSRPAKKARRSAALTTGSLLLAAAQQVDPNLQAGEAHDQGENDDDDDGDVDSVWSRDTETGSPRSDARRNAQLHTLTRELHIDELREHFNKPIVEVAKEFGICTTFLKKICRRCGIKRWPHRQIRSLTRTVEMLRQAEANATSVQEKAKFAAQIAQVEAKKRAVIDDPDANGKLERVKKSVLNRSGSSPGGRKNSVDSIAKTKTAGVSPPLEPAVQVDLLQAVAAAAAAAARSTDPAAVSVLTPTMTTAAEATAAEALLFSASPRIMVASVDVVLPAVDLSSDAFPAMTPTASSTPESKPHHGHKISPNHRKLLAVLTADGEHRVRSSSLGSLQDLGSLKQLSENEEKPAALAPAAAVETEAS